MKNAKRILAHFLAVIMVLSCLTALSIGGTVTASAESVYNSSAAKTLPTPVGDVYTITTANEFVAFANALNNDGNNFSGKTIKLACDIVLNTGNASSWGSSAPAYSWSGIGKSWTLRFAGSFDGQGHYISGIYNSNNNSAGLFGRIVGGTEFKNVTIKNSYFRSTAGTGGDGIGALIGMVDPNWAAGTTTVSNVHVESTYIVTTGGCPGVGGIVGKATNFGSSALIVQNCTFDGSITAGTSSQVGGIVGYVNQGTNFVLENCAARTTAMTGNNDVGGLVGQVNLCNAMISNCLATGSVNASNRASGSDGYHTGAIVGFIQSNGENVTVQMSNVIAAVTSNHPEAVITTIKGTSGDYTITFELEDIFYDSTKLPNPGGLIRRDNSNSVYAKVNNSSRVQGSNWYLEAQLGSGSSGEFATTAQTSAELKGKKMFDFWTKVANDYPKPPTVCVPDFYNGTTRSTYITEGTTITIYTAEQLMAFANATLSSSFNGYTIKLARDIIINRGTASAWASSAPSYNWECSSSWGNRFAGTFDGQGHTISGVYSKLGKHTGLFQCVAIGATIQNLNLFNSYFETSVDSKWAGALIGYIDSANGGSGPLTISNVSVDAIVKGTNAAGGLIGADTTNGNVASTTTNITNCAFNGTVYCSYRHVGGMIGYLYSNKTFTGCTVKGTMTAAGGLYVGGYVGYMNGGGSRTLSFSNCVVNGSLNGSEQVGGLVGRVVEASSVSISNCLVQSDINIGGNTGNTQGGLIGYYSTENSHAGSASISNTLISVRGNATNKVYSYSMTHYGNANLTITFTNVKLDSTRYNGQANNSYSTASSYRKESGSVTTTTTSALVGQSIFTGWTSVTGNYPVPSAKAIDFAKIQAFTYYADDVILLGYQVKKENSTYTIRVIAAFRNASAKSYTTLGFDDPIITRSGTSKGETRWYCKNAYKSVTGNEETYAANEYFSEAIFCLQFKNVPTGAAVNLQAQPMAMTSSSLSSSVYGSNIFNGTVILY